MKYSDSFFSPKTLGFFFSPHSVKSLSYIFGYIAAILEAALRDMKIHKTVFNILYYTACFLL